MNIAAFDIGGTSLKMGMVAVDGSVSLPDTAAINGSDGDIILAAMTKWLNARKNLTGIAISAPGYVNPLTGYITMGGAIRKFDGFDLSGWLSARTGLPVTVENDANCVLLAERWVGEAQALSDFLVMTIGTGIGGAIWSNNQLVHGHQYRAGEFGYMLAEKPGTRGVPRYTMNEVCTMSVLRKRYSEAVGRQFDEVTGEQIFDGYDAGDAICVRLVDDFFNGIGSGIYNLVNLFDPQKIFIGGGISERHNFLPLLKRHLTWFGLQDHVDIVTHGNHAGLIGAAYHFKQMKNLS